MIGNADRSPLRASARAVQGPLRGQHRAGVDHRSPGSPAVASSTARALLISPPALSDEDTASCAALAAFPVAARVEAAVSGAALSAARAGARLSHRTCRSGDV